MRRVDDVERLIDAAVPEGPITLVVHDWGGMIGMAYATRHPERIRRLVVLNTSAFLLPETKPFAWALWLCRTSIGAFLVRGFNAFSSIASRVCVCRKPMPTAIRLAYVAPYNSWANRIATLRFVQDIPLRPADRAYPIVTEVQDNVQQFKDTPTLICWGLSVTECD